MRKLWFTERSQVFAPYRSASGGRPRPMLSSRYRPFGAYYDAARADAQIAEVACQPLLEKTNNSSLENILVTLTTAMRL
jgi:hypothetical protein